MAYSKRNKHRSDIERLKTAMGGFWLGFAEEFTAKRIGISGFFLGIFLCLWLQDWQILKQTWILTVLSVFAEIVNTSIEYLCDYVQPEKHDMIKKVKDVAAGGTFLLVTAFVFITILDILHRFFPHFLFY